MRGDRRSKPWQSSRRSPVKRRTSALGLSAGVTSSSPSGSRSSRGWSMSVSLLLSPLVPPIVCLPRSPAEPAADDGAGSDPFHCFPDLHNPQLGSRSGLDLRGALAEVGHPLAEHERCPDSNYPVAKRWVLDERAGD